MDWILRVSDGSIGLSNDNDITLDIPEDLNTKKKGDSLESIVNSNSPFFLDNMNDPNFFQNKAVLAPKNVIVDMVNNYMLSLMPGEETECLSYDSPLSANDGVDCTDDLHTTKNFNTISASGLPSLS